MLADLVAKFAECPEEVEMGDESVDERLVGVASIQSQPPWSYMLMEQPINRDQEWG